MFRKENTLLISLFVLITLCRPISAAFIKSRNHTQASIEALGICVCCKGATRSTPRIKYIRVFSLCFSLGPGHFFDSSRMLGCSLTQMRSHLGFCWLCFSCFCIPTRKEWFRAPRVAQRNKGRPLAVEHCTQVQTHNSFSKKMILYTTFLNLSFSL